MCAGAHGRLGAFQHCIVLPTDNLILRTALGDAGHCSWRQVGWAVEGAVGSEFKIDVTYLSPNVNLAQRLQGLADKQYGTSVLLSHTLHQELSPGMRRQARPRTCWGLGAWRVF